MTNELEQLANVQKELIKYLVFSGGGAKGTIYSGVYEELIKSGVMDEIEGIAGSSVGAMAAAIGATGASIEDIKKIFLKTNLNDLQGSGIIQKDAKPLYDLIHNSINNNIEKYFEKNDITEKCERRLESLFIELEILQNENSANLKEKIEIVKDKIQQLTDVINEPEKLSTLHNSAKNDGKITFGDLDILHLIDPITFKRLVVTATNKTNGELKIFDAQNTPNVEIALACRASASLPLRFEPVTIDGEQYVDGGYRDNIPIKHFENKKNIAQDVTDSFKLNNNSPQKRTLILAFGSHEENSPAHIAVYSSQEQITNFGKLKKFLLDVVLKFMAKVGGDFEHTKDKNKGFENVRENALNTVILDTKDVSTLDFKKASNKAEYLHEKGKIQTARYFNNHSIGNNQDINLEQKEFILKIYEETQFPNNSTKFTNLAVGNKLDNSQFILDLCKDRTWEMNSKTEVLSALVLKLGQTGGANKYSTNTHMMNKIVEVLNEPTTPSAVKSDFIKLLDIKIAGKENDYKFQTKDFDKLVRQHNLPTKKSSITKTKSYVEELFSERKVIQEQSKQR